MAKRNRTEDDFRAEMDAETLQRAVEIQNDRKRRDKALAQIRAKREQADDVLRESPLRSKPKARRAGGKAPQRGGNAV